MGPALLPTPLAPVAFAGVSPSREPRKARSKAVSPGARAGIRFRQAARRMQSTFPAGLAVPRPEFPWGLSASSGRSPAETAPLPSTPSRKFRPAGGGPAAALFRRLRVDPKIAANRSASGPRGIRHRLEAFRPYRSRPVLTPSEERSGLLAPMNGRCAGRASRSSFARPSYPLSPDLSVDKGG